MNADPARQPFRGESIFAAAGHLALWVGLYFAGAYVAAVLLLGETIHPGALGASFCAGVGLYLIDRVKIRDAWLDPADIEGDERRHRFLRQHRRTLRVAAWIILAAGYLSVSATHPSNLVLPLIGIGGVIWYSKPTRRAPRLKDRAMLKNLLPALAIASLAVILAETSVWHVAHHATVTTGLVFAGLVLQVAADAMLCDLDDLATDAAHGTQTLALALGRDRTIALGAALQLAAGALWVARGSEWNHVLPGGCICLANVAGTTALWLRPTGPIRDLIDLKLPATVLIVWLVILGVG